ncbi:MAG: Z1 domain-containing protein [Saprospiraceae bacterium]
MKKQLGELKNPPNFEGVLQEIIEVILDTNIELVIQGSKDINWDNASSHILVGADMLNRGYTIEGLTVTYMPRHSISKSNADTIQQRCRFFGYKKNYLDSCRVFLPNDSIKEYVDYVKHERIMRTNLKENSLEELEQLLVLSNEMNPTRNNILSKDIIKHKLTGWRQMNALQHIEENTRFISNFLKNRTFLEFKNYNSRTRKHRYIKLRVNEIIEFLRDFKISNMPDALRKSSTIQYLRYVSDKTRIKDVYLFEMAYEVTEGRERKLMDKNGKLKINNIFSGRSGNYLGDKAIRFENTFCIQIHKIKLKHSSLKWNGKSLYTLGIYYPNAISHSFVGVIKKDERNF